MSILISCPIRSALNDFRLGNKWTLEIIRDLFYGKRHFKDFLETNPRLSRKVLAERLKGLCTNGLVEKQVVHASPLVVEYALTPKGEALNRVLYELARFNLRVSMDQPALHDPDAQSFLNQLKEKLRIYD